MTELIDNFFYIFKVFKENKKIFSLKSLYMAGKFRTVLTWNYVTISGQALGKPGMYEHDQAPIKCIGEE